MEQTAEMAGNASAAAGSPGSLGRDDAIEVHGATTVGPRLTRRHLASQLALFGLAVLLVGILAAIVWKLTAPTPTVTVSGDGTATITNRTITEYFGADADFMIIGMFGGLGLGALCWHWLKALGWPVALIAVAAGMLGALVCWRMGAILGPHNFFERLAYASTGEQVAIDLTLRTPTAWLFWPVGTLIPILLYSALGHDDREIRQPTAEPEEPEVTQPSRHRSVRFPIWRNDTREDRKTRRKARNSS
ncbi:hypothetical protein [Propionibacterium sp.]|uniref:hypothetical protein n=1 Tax=Propionibacterium sp. TaxID=1977903 RepID=UPI0039E8093F